MSRLPNFLENRLTDDAVRLLSPRKILDTYFCYRLSRPQGYIAAARIRSIKNVITLSGIGPVTFRLVA
jgi:hypothetical protein